MVQGKSTMRRLAELALGRWLNDSTVYQAYLRIRHPDHYRSAEAQRRFYHELIRSVGAGIVFDVGANTGEKAIIFATTADRVVCVEPSPLAARLLRERFASSPKITVVAKGAGAQAGSFPFHMFEEADCYNTFSPKWVASLSTPDGSAKPAKKVSSVIDVPVITLDALIAEVGTPSYIKIDVEGFELEVLKGLSRSVRLLSIECNLPEFSSETLECLARLEQLEPETTFNYCILEPPSKLASDRWLSRSEIADVVTSGRHRFMEIYARAPDSRGA